MTLRLQSELLDALERPHRLGMIGGDLGEQLAHCASFSSVLAEVWQTRTASDARPPARAADLGTGGGLPGVALAAWWPETDWTLIDLRSSRAAEVERVVLSLALGDRVAVEPVAAQLLGHEPTHREQYEVVVARAFGQPSLTAECATGLLAVGGVFLISEPPSTPDSAPLSESMRWNEAGLTALGLSLPQFRHHDGHSFAVFTKLAAAAPHLPRLPPRPSRGWL